MERELSLVYREEKKLKDHNDFPTWAKWVDERASLKQKTELRHKNLLNYKPFIYKKFP